MIRVHSRSSAAGIAACAFTLAAAGAQAQTAAPANCGGCHPSIAATYQRTGMARSFDRPKPGNAIEDYSNRNSFYHQASGIHFTMTQRGGRVFERQYQIGPDGKETNSTENEVDFIVGSGHHSRTYLHRTRTNMLVELPLGWYAEKGGYWAMNPGYDRADHPDLRRRIGYDCMFCHNAYPEVQPESVERGTDPVFTRVPEGIDCQRCHGPGLEHVALASKPGARREDIRAAIVNPARLPRERQMEVCMQCHLESTSFSLPYALVRYERVPFSYRPGEPLAQFMLHFDHAPGQGRDDKFEIASSAYRLRKSACFEKSNGAMTCTTCHNPHDVPRAEEAARHYTSVCRQCHGAALDRLVNASRHPRSDDCIGCHMPKRRTDDVVHVVMTDHYIQRRRPARDLLAEIPERHETDETAYHGEVVPYYPAAPLKAEDELYLGAAQVIQRSNLSGGITRLSAAIEKYRPQRAEYYSQLADAWKNSGQPAQALPWYEEALRRQPNLAASQKLALCLLALRRQPRAAEILKQALERAPDDAATWHMLGTAYVEQGNASDALAAFQRAADLDPEMPEAFNSLGGTLLETGDAARAEPALRNAIRLEPNYAEAHNNLGGLLSLAGHLEEARYHFEAALRLRADYNSARYNYGVALGRAGLFDEAQRQIETLLRSDPRSAEAHEFLGSVLVAKGQRAAAIEHFREALRLRPDFPRAHLHLGSALADSGDLDSAVPHLRQAAQGSDPAVRKEALAILERLGKDR